MHFHNPTSLTAYSERSIRAAELAKPTAEIHLINIQLIEEAIRNITNPTDKKRAFRTLDNLSSQIFNKNEDHE